MRIDRLATEFGVSEMTIRRDLDELEALGVARRVRGGAVAIGPEPFAERHRHNARAKARIAGKLLDLIPNRGTVAFDASTTVYRLAAALDGAQDLVVVSNGLDTFQALVGKPGVVATLTGGIRGAPDREPGRAGRHSQRQGLPLRHVRVLGGRGRPEVGSSEPSLEEAEVKRALSAAASRIVLAVDHSKLGTRAQARMFALDEISLLVTDLEPDDARLNPYRASVEVR